MKKSILSILIFILIISCTACGSTSDGQETNWGFLLGITNNNPVFDDSIDQFESLSKYANSQYSIILADGEPNLILKAKIPDLKEKKLTSQMLERVQDGVQKDIIQKLSEAAPDNPETDIASALELGARTLREKAVDGVPNILVICHNGISTSGAINMLETPVSSLDIDQSVEQLSTNLNIDLHDIDVIWYYLSDARGNQNQLNSQEKTKLKDFYKKLLTKLGAKSVKFMDTVAPSDCYSFPEQPVSCMPTDGNPSQLVQTIQGASITNSKDVAKIFEEGKALSFSEKDIKFKPGTAEFLDEASAQQSISHVIEYIQDNKDTPLLICGSCAGDEGVDVERSYVSSLSTGRAEAVKKIIYDQLKITDNSITINTKGLGSSGPFHTTGLGLGDDASVNRTVTILPANSEIAQNIINNY